ncbi:S8 family peptidase [Actinophytocola sediminis]
MKRARGPIAAVIVAVITAVLVTTAVPAVAEGTVIGTAGPAAIRDSYLVVYADAALATQDVDPLTDRLAADYDATVEHTYRHALHGFAGTLTERAARRLAADPAVAYVEQDSVVTAAGTQPDPPSWGLDRIDQRDLPLDNSFSYQNTAANVTAYVIDSGIFGAHQDFGGRVTWGTNTVDDNDTDCDGHGTHVAGSLGGATYGVAKQVRLVAVKVFDCDGNGTLAGMVAGVDWVTGHHTGGPAVANMSLSVGGSPVMDDATQASIADGVTYVVAAGNGNFNGGVDACLRSPARLPAAITAGASSDNDHIAYYSNYGTCVDLFAPGDSITSAGIAGDTATETWSGTSMATPQTAGAAAILLSADPTLTPAQVADAIVADATPDRMPHVGPGSPNRLLHVG